MNTHHLTEQLGDPAIAGLLAQLPDTWEIIAGRALASEDATMRDVDLIIIAPRIIFTIGLIPWDGAITISRDVFWGTHGEVLDRPIAHGDLTAGMLTEALRLAVPAAHAIDGVFVTYVALCWRASSINVIDGTPRMQCCRADDLIGVLYNLEALFGSDALEPLQPALVTAVRQLPAALQLPDELTQQLVSPQVIGPTGDWILDLRDDAGRRRVMLAVQIAPGAWSPAHDAALERYAARAESLWKAGAIAQIKTALIQKDGRVMLVTDPLRGTPLGALPLPALVRDLHRDLLRAAACFRTLAVLHRQQCVHGALTPAQIWIDGTTSPRATCRWWLPVLPQPAPTPPTVRLRQAEDPWAAPGVAAQRDRARPADDCATLAAMFIARWARLSPEEVWRRGSDAASQVLLRWGGLAWSATLREVATLLDRAVSRGPDAPNAAAIGARLQSCAERLNIPTSDAVDVIGTYRVRHMLDAGDDPLTVLAHRPSDPASNVVLKSYADDAAWQRARPVAHALRTTPSAALVTVDALHDEQRCIVLRYLVGPTVAGVAGEFPWAIDRWSRLASGVLDVLLALETRRLRHGGVRAEHLIMLNGDEQRLVLVGFGSASAELAQPGDAGDQRAFLGILYRALTGTAPEGDDQSRVAPRLMPLVRMLHQLVAMPQALPVDEIRQRIDTARRHQSAPARGDDPKLTNPWVDQIRRLYRNSRGGNADNRGLDSDFVRQTYVPTALDQLLLPRVLQQRPPAVFLSGNPGDGKTAFLERVRMALLEHGAQLVQSDAAGWEYVLGGHTFRSCYDASESHGSSDADGNVAHVLRGFDGADAPPTSLTVLLAINDGRLDDFFGRRRTEYPWLAQRVAARLDGGAPDPHVWLVDLKRRAFVGMPGSAESLFRQIVATLVAPAAWQSCDGCAARSICPIRANAAALRQPTVVAQLEILFLLAHLRQRQHITIRDLRSALAWVLTGDLDCAAVHQARDATREIAMVEQRYWQLLFTAPAGDPLLDELRALDPALHVLPHLDRRLHGLQRSARALERASLFDDRVDVPPEQWRDVSAWRAAMKRRLCFEGTPELRPTPYSLLPYQAAQAFVAALGDAETRAAVLPILAAGLLRTDGVFEALPPGALYVRAAGSLEQDLMILKPFPLSAFALEPVEPDEPHVEHIAEYLELRTHTGEPRLTITLDAFELLLRCAAGLHPGSPEFQPLLEDLAPFKSALLLADADELLLLDQGQVTGLVQRGRQVHRVQQKAPR
jgi:hypothetical protein